MITTPKVVHVIGPYSGHSPLRQRQELFLESVDRAHRANVVLLAATDDGWQRTNWETLPLGRTATILGEPSNKPFLKDLCDSALERTGPNDWILYSNIDCSFAPDFYDDLLNRRATVVEYQRQDVEGKPQTLDELFANPRTIYSVGIDGIAIRSQFYREIRNLLPDFVLGEPHWDTVYSGMFRKMVPVQRDSLRMFHPKHDRLWDLRQPNAAGRHNHELFVEALNHGYAEKTMITDVEDRTDTAVVIAVFGTDPGRVQANTEGIRKQLEQDLYADVYLVELLVDGAKSVYPEDVLSKVRHLTVQTTEACLDLFQKEALLNYGWRAALAHHAYDYFIFTDADVYSPEPFWFRHIRGRLRRDPARAVQGWRTVRDTVDDSLHYSSVGAAYVLNHPTDLPLNPGICWGLHRALLEMGNGFNSYCLDCGGDSAFVVEYLNTSQLQYDPWLYQWNWFREVERELPFHAELDCVSVDLVHVHHGYLKERNYDGFRYAMDSLRPLSELVHINAHGLLEWRDPACVERKILCQRHAMGSRAEVDDLLSQFSYPRIERPQSRRNAVPSKTLFHIPGYRPPRIPDQPLVHHPAPHSGLKIFDPEQVFRSDFPFSWCDGVVKAEGSTYIPIVDTEDAAILLLDGKPDTTYVVCALPLQPTWQPVSLRKFRSLEFSIRVPEPGPRDVFVSMVSQCEDGRERTSDEISLKGHGLEPGAWTRVAIPIDQFSGNDFDRASARLAKFIAHESCRIELSEIYVTEEMDSGEQEIPMVTVAEPTPVIFSREEIEQFITDGFVILRRGFSKEVAAECREFIWRKIGEWADCTAPEHCRVKLNNHFSETPFDRLMNERLETALADLTGEQRFVSHQEFGGWQILFPGFFGADNWHIDGENTNHHLTSREHGIVGIFLFSDIGPGDGGTHLVRGSHLAVTRLLAEAEPAGLDNTRLNENLPEVNPADVVEVTGEAGDAVMLHPLLIHGFGANQGKRIRFACNPHFQLREPLNVDRSNGSYSPLERVIQRAGVELE
jgi:hypothetical protein